MRAGRVFEYRQAALPRMRAGARLEGALMDRYVCFEGAAPGWLRRRLMHFRAADGAVGWELDFGGQAVTLRKGDLVIRTDLGKIRVKRAQKRNQNNTKEQQNETGEEVLRTT